MKFPTLESTVGNTPLVRLQRLPGDTTNTLLVKLEGNNPAGSVKDRPALAMIKHAEERGEIKPGDTLIEATSGNTGIALAMAAAMKGYRMVLVMPEHMSVERRAVMKTFGAEIILVSKEASMEGARDLAKEMEARGEGRVLDQFSNPDNPLAHYEGTGPEIWRDTEGSITHFVSAMGTTGTIMGTSRYLKEQNSAVEIVGVTPSEGSAIPGIRRWSEAYLPSIFNAASVDRTIEVDQADAERVTLALAAREGIFAGVSSGGAVAAVTTSPVITADWEADSKQRWTVPVGGGVGKIFRVGKQALNAQVQAYYNVEKPDIKGDWSLRLQLQFMFPR